MIKGKLSIAYGIVVVVCAGYGFPIFAQKQKLISHHKPLAEPALEKPAAGTVYRDPVFQTRIRRITDAKSDKSDGYISYYPKLNPFNADETRILIYERGGRWWLYSTDGKRIGRLPIKNGQTDPQPRWHPRDADVIIWLDANRIMSYNLSTKRLQSLAEFTAYQFVTGFDEGNLSADGRRIALAGKNWPWRTGLQEFFVYDFSLGSILGPKLPATGRGVDWVSISPSGEYMVVHVGHPPGAGQWQGTDVYRVPEMTLMPYPYYPFSDHADIGYDHEGEEVYVTDNAEGGYADKLRHIEAYRLRDGRKRDLLGIKWGMSMVISCRNLAAPGWAIISTYSSPKKLATPEVYPFQDEIFAVRLDGSYTVRRLAHHRSQRFSAGDYSYNNYWDQPNGAVSASGRYILFTSNWREPGAPEDVYLIDLSEFGDWLVGDAGSDHIAPLPPARPKVKAIGGH